MANQVEPGTAGGAAQEPGSLAGTAPGAEAAEYAAPSPDTFGTTALAQEDLVHQAPGSSATTHVTFHGRPVSWVAVSTVMVGFLVGALALVFGHHGPTWWVFWVGAGIVVVGALLALATDIFEDWY
jgi:hypothetical protein